MNNPRPVLGTAADDARRAEQGDMLRTLIHVDDPEHRQLRGVTAEWFLPKNLVTLEGQLAALAKRYVDRMVELGGECDFAKDITMQMPLNVILAIMGLPETDYPRMLKLTQELFGAADEDLRRGDSAEDLIAVVQDFFVYFTQLTEDRRAHPTDDLVSVVANATIDGEPLTMMQTISYYVIAATAGHDTTASAMAVGLHALIEHPDQLPSANRDEEVFDDPFRFDIGRSPNKHLSFGFGVHYCLGAMLARMELKALYTELVPRLRSVELAGDPKLMKTIFVGGLKSLPIRYEVAPA